MAINLHVTGASSSVDPGFTATDFNDHRGTQAEAQGGESIVRYRADRRRRANRRLVRTETALNPGDVASAAAPLAAASDDDPSISRSRRQALASLWRSRRVAGAQSPRSVLVRCARLASRI
jgi:hypothetical protein